MKLYIDPTGGMAGDMFSAALISIGVPLAQIKTPMIYAASKLGEAEIKSHKSSDGADVLLIDLKSNSDHLGEKTGKKILNETFKTHPLDSRYIDFAYSVFSILLHAEEKAHHDYQIEISGHHHHHGPVLHEAQDIIIDIIGAAYGLSYLKVLPEILQIQPVSVGGGEISFSHGTFSIPAPATLTIINQYDLKVQSGPIDVELFTPTGAAILAALKPVYLDHKPEKMQIKKTGCSRGTRQLDIPPLKLHLIS